MASASYQDYNPFVESRQPWRLWQLRVAGVILADAQRLSGPITADSSIAMLCGPVLVGAVDAVLLRHGEGHGWPATDAASPWSRGVLREIESVRSEAGTWDV